MIHTKSLSEKRMLTECTINGKTAVLLLDSGASVGMLDENQRKKYDLKRGRRYNGQLIGAGGDISSPYMCDTIVELHGKKVAQFLLADIDNIRKSIKRETGIEIVGILSLRQMKDLGIQMDFNDNLIIVE